MLKKNRHLVLVIWLLILVMVVAGSLHPGAGPPTSTIRLDLILHFLLYALLSGLAVIIFHNRKTALLIAISLLPLGTLLECAQLYIRSRTFGLDDLIANCIGVLIGLLVGIAYRAKSATDWGDQNKDKMIKNLP